MGRTNVYSSRRLVAVTVGSSSTIKYGFSTNIDEGEGTTIGQVDMDAVTGTVVIGCNSPKPGKAKKANDGTTNGYSITSWIDGALLNAPPAGWQIIQRPRFRGSANGAATKAVYVTTSGVKYAWMMPTRLYTKIAADRAGLGITDAAGLSANAQKELVWGCSSPVPARAAKSIAGTDGVDTVSTFYGDSATLPAGWTTIAPAKLR